MTKNKTYEKEGDPTFWTTKEAAADLRVSTQTIRAARTANKLPATKFGNGYRFKPADVREYADNLEEA